MLLELEAHARERCMRHAAARVDRALRQGQRLHCRGGHPRIHDIQGTPTEAYEHIRIGQRDIRPARGAALPDRCRHGRVSRSAVAWNWRWPAVTASQSAMLTCRSDCRRCSSGFIRDLAAQYAPCGCWVCAWRWN